MDTVDTLRLAQRGLKAENPEVSSLARTALSIVAFNLRHPKVKISDQQKKLIDNLAQLAN